MAATKDRTPIELTQQQARRLHAVVTRISASLDQGLIRIDFQERRLQHARERVEQLQEQARKIVTHLDEHYPLEGARQRTTRQRAKPSGGE
jgi:DNA repair ATPase RecN